MRTLRRRWSRTTQSATLGDLEDLGNGRSCIDGPVDEPITDYGSVMARLIKFEALKPIKIEPQEKAIFICACGLSKNFPFCDGHHKGCAVEQPGCTYIYDAQGENPREVGDASTAG